MRPRLSGIVLNDGDNPMDNQFLDTAQAAFHIGKSKSTLEWWRGLSPLRGPTFYRIGHRISYKTSDLDAFMHARVVRIEP